MEWQIPIQKVEIVNINIGSPWARERREYSQKALAPLSYFGTQFRLPFVSLLFPPLPVIEYNPLSGKLSLDMSETSLATIKLTTLQETLINSIIYHQYAWFKSNYSKEDVKNGFQPIIEGNTLILHCPNRGIPIYKDGDWVKNSNVELRAGMRIRVAVKIHGISFLNRNEQRDIEWTGRSRIQHRIQGIIVQG
jgi:hypothetical protein